MYLCIVDFTAGGTIFITDEQMDVRILIFQSINHSLLCFSGPPWTWRAATQGSTGFSCCCCSTRSCLMRRSGKYFGFFAGLLGCWRMTHPPAVTLTITFTFICNLTETSGRTRILIKMMDLSSAIIICMVQWHFAIHGLSHCFFLAER